MKAPIKKASLNHSLIEEQKNNGAFDNLSAFTYDDNRAGLLSEEKPA